jgi:hypothetical protein
MLNGSAQFLPDLERVVGEVLERVSNLAVLVFVVTCMAGAGPGLGVRDVVTPLRRGRFVLLALIGPT